MRMYRTPEEIKKGLKNCCNSAYACEDCPYDEFSGLGCKVYRNNDAYAYIKQLEARVPRWRSIMEDIPVNEDDVLVLIGGKDADVGWFNGYDGEWRTYGLVAGDVTHWMPLPEPPKEDS